MNKAVAISAVLLALPLLAFWFTSYPAKQAKPLAPIAIPFGINVSQVEEHCFSCHGKATCDMETVVLLQVASQKCLQEGNSVKFCAAFRNNAIRKFSSCIVEN